MWEQLLTTRSPQSSCSISPLERKKKKKQVLERSLHFHLLLSLRLSVLFTAPPGDKLSVPLRKRPQRGRQSSSVPLDLLNVELASELIHVLPHATQPRPQRLTVLPIGRPWHPVHLLDGGVRRHVPGDLALFGPTVLRAAFVRRRVVSGAPESGEGLARLADVFACDSRAAEAVEIPKFLWKYREICIFLDA